MKNSRFKKYPTKIHEKVDLARQGRLPNVIAKLETCWVVARDTQPLEGCCVIFCDPVVGSLNDLPEKERMLYSRDMARVGDALMKVNGAYRINYETWANVDQALHTHIIPRYGSEPEEKRVKPAILAYDFDSARKFDPEKYDAAFVQKMREALLRP